MANRRGVRTRDDPKHFMTTHSQIKPLVVRFHKNGLLMIEDANGTLHVLEPQKTLRDAAKYIWREEVLSDLRVEGEEASFKDYKNVKFVKLTADKEERLRSTN